ncbi:MAG: DUF2017 family protein [Acidimicrobiales bacterium]
MGWIFTRLPDGDLKLDLGPNERAVLRSLPGQLAEVLRDAPGEAALTRLSPPAYVEEPEHEEEYRRFMGDDLRQRQLAALGLMGESAGATQLTPEQAEGWLCALNSLRLVLGTQLDVGEDTDDDLDGLDDDDIPTDPDDPRGPALHLYRYLSMLLEDLVETMSEGLPEVEEEP